jgi:hypothetical protein
MHASIDLTCLVPLSQQVLTDGVCGGHWQLHVGGQQNPDGSSAAHTHGSSACHVAHGQSWHKKHVWLLLGQ